MLYNKITNKYKAPKKVVNTHKFYKHLQFKNLIYLFIKAANKFNLSEKKFL